MGTPAESIRLTLSQRARRRVHAWARRRQGPDGREVIIRTRRIYALPTRSGLLFALMVFTMLLGAMNYNNNMGFALTFLLAALGIVSMHFCHRNLAGLRVRLQGIGTAFAGGKLPVHLALDTGPGDPRDALELRWEDAGGAVIGIEPRGVRQVTLALSTERRGPLPLPALRISTRYPLGLLRAWTWLHLDGPAVVYPRPEPRGAVLPVDGDGGQVNRTSTRGEEDFNSLRRLQAGDPPGRIAWKTYARTGELLVREYRGGGTPAPLWIDWDAQLPLDVEARISRLTRLVLEASETGQPWGLRLPGQVHGPAAGDPHLHRCLHCLATFQLPDAPLP